MYYENGFINLFVPFYLSNIAIRKLRITYMAHIFLLDNTTLESWRKGINLLEYKARGT